MTHPDFDTLTRFIRPDLFHEHVGVDLDRLDPGLRYGWKTVRPDGRTRGDFRWPLTAGETVTDVEPDSPLDEHDSPCPMVPGDGLCVGLTASGLSSSNIRSATLLLVSWDDVDTAAETGDKVRVRGPVTVAAVTDWHRLLREGAAAADGDWQADLSGAYLSGAYLGRADLRGADLGRADLRRAYLGGAYLSWADLGGWERGPDGYARKTEA